MALCSTIETRWILFPIFAWLNIDHLLVVLIPFDPMYNIITLGTPGLGYLIRIMYIDQFIVIKVSLL